MEADQIVALLPIPALAISGARRVLALNPEGEALLGAGGRGRHYMTMLRQPDLVERIEAALAGGGAGQGRFTRREAGRAQDFKVAIRPLPAGGGVLVAFEDVTPFEEARRMRSDFVANVSHELRTPLTALKGFIETLRGPARDDPQARARFLEIMATEAERMDRLIEDLLSLSRVESRERQRPTERVELCGLIRDQAAALGPQAQKRDVRLVLEGCEGRALVPGDADQLRQVFANLIENAIKYGAEGGEVRLVLSPIAHEPALRGAGVMVRVIDRGEGIPEHHIGRLTERFYRVDTHRSRDMGGTGLGLAIVKHILNRHRGRLRIASTPGQGSTFTVLLPAG